MFKNRVLRKIFGPKRDEVTGDTWNLHKEEPYDLYCPSNIIRMIKSRRMRYDRHVECMGETRCLQVSGGET